jgi:hypothetical protein
MDKGAGGTDGGAAGSTWLRVGLTLSLALPSFMLVEKYFGAISTAGYLLVVGLAVWGIVRIEGSVAKLTSRLAGAHVFALAILTLAVLVVGFFVLYPLANSGQYGRGVDNDEALNTAVRELFSGRYPYYLRTYLEAPISPLPGELLLASPFVLLGNGAYQNFFWLSAYFIFAVSYLKDSRSALLLLWTLLVLSPTVVHNWVVGTDYIANALYVMLAMLWMGKAVDRSNTQGWQKVVAAVFLGIALSSRLNFLLLTPLLFSLMVRNAGWRPAIAYSALVVVTFAGVTLPFYLYDPAGFSPLHTSNFLGRFDSVFPFAGVSLLFVTLLLSAVLARFQEPRLNAFLGNGAIVLAFPIVWGVTIMSIQRGSLDFEYGFYGVFFLFFGATACWRALFDDDNDGAKGAFTQGLRP